MFTHYLGGIGFIVLLNVLETTNNLNGQSEFVIMDIHPERSW